MDKYQYKVSVIVPVYNVENYLRDCLDSLVAQTIDHGEMEVLLINDGSTDNSLEICYEYAQSYFMFKVFTKENEGVSIARNLGLKNATGKYIFYLDSDDTISKETIKTVSDFFDEHYEEIDMVTYPEASYDTEDNKLPLHYRYKYLVKTGIYDLKKMIFITQVRLNVMVKNYFEENLLFDEKIGYHEDQIYCNEILQKKLKIGFVAGCEYKYKKHMDSITGENSNAIFLFEKTTAYWESVFNSYDVVPKYYQALFFHDISWKFSESILWPYHYSESELLQSKQRIIALLNRVDNDVIMSYPRIDNYQRLYWIRCKTNRTLLPIVEMEEMRMVDSGSILYCRKDVEVILKRILVKKNKIKIVGYFKSPFFSCIKDVKLFAKVNEQIEELDLKLASASYYKSKEITDTFWTLIYEREIEDSTQLEFKVVLDGIEYPTVFYNCDTTPFYQGRTNKYCVENLSIEQTKYGFILNNIQSKREVQISIDNNSKKCSNEILELRKRVAKNEDRVWLYYDNNTVVKDNGYYQFLHDIEQNDGVKRYYILTNTSSDYKIKEMFDEKIMPYVIRFGSDKHQYLYLIAEKILTGFIEKESLVPFKTNLFYQIADIFNAEIIYLQHGVLHAHLPWYYTPIGVSVDKVVISTYFEKSNFVENYGFYEKDLICTGMARYDKIDKFVSNPRKKILFAPSWRSYLVGTIKEDNAVRTGYDSTLLNSNYYKNIMKFLSEPILLEFLDKENIELDIKLHPNFLQCYRHLINFADGHIHLAEANVNLNEYSLFITDFSSYVFDYAYLERPILYFVPDYIEFKSGMNRYRKLDLPWEDAFGKLFTDSEKAVQEVIRICNNNFEADEIYKDRMGSFYFKMNNCSKKLYDYLMNN